MIDWFGPVIDEYYASTEGVGGTIIFSDEWLRKPGSVGKARNENRIVIMDDDGQILPAGPIGPRAPTRAEPSLLAERRRTRLNSTPPSISYHPLFFLKKQTS